MRHSDIFEEYIKIAEERGLLKDKSDKLHDVKPETAEGMSYKRNIIEIAHPEPVVIAPSYDKVNGLVENENERQNITLNILNKMPTGRVTHHKNASKLLNSLIKTSSKLDKDNEHELMALSDSCLENLYKLQKQANPAAAVAAAPLLGIGATPLLVGAALVLGVVYAHQHLARSDHGMIENANQLLKSIDDLATNAKTLGFGYTVDDKVRTDLDKLRQYVSNFTTRIYPKVKAVMDGMPIPSSSKEVLDLAQSQEVKDIVDAKNSLNNYLSSLLPFFNKILSNFGNTSFKREHVSDKGYFSELIEDFHISGGGSSLFSDKFENVKKDLELYINSVQNIKNILDQSDKEGEKVAAELQQAAQQDQEPGLDLPSAKKDSKQDSSDFSMDELKKLF